MISPTVAFRRTAVGVAALALTLLIALQGPPSAAGADAARPQHVATTMATAPRYISGYSDHCARELAADGISREAAGAQVANGYLSAVWQAEGQTWRYNGPVVTIVLNVNGYCVTAFKS